MGVVKVVALTLSEVREKVHSFVSGIVPRKNRLYICPLCGEKLSSDKNSITSERGFIYRNRVCQHCALTFHTKQDPEEITGVSRNDKEQVWPEQFQG